MHRFELPPVFYEDTAHSHCFMDGPTVVKRTRRHLVVEMTTRDAAELWSRAEYYADPCMAAEFIESGCLGIISSARATLRRMRDQGYSHELYRAAAA